MRLRRLMMNRGPGRSPAFRHPVSVVISVLAVIGVIVGTVLATMGGKPSAVSGSDAGLPTARPAPADTTGPVVPALGGNAEGGGRPIAIPVVRAVPRASAAAAGGGRPGSGPV